MNARSRMGDGPGGRAGAILFQQAQAGCRDSVEQLMSVHDGLVHAVVRRQVLGDLPYAEALQAGRLGLWRAILGFDPQRGTAFSTYAWISIVHHVWREVRRYPSAHCACDRPMACISSPASGSLGGAMRPQLAVAAAILHGTEHATVPVLHAHRLAADAHDEGEGLERVHDHL